MRTRDQIADDLISGLDGCPDEEISDHKAIADAIRDGDSWEQISEMDQIEFWPETYVWVENELN